MAVGSRPIPDSGFFVSLGDLGHVWIAERDAGHVANVCIDGVYSGTFATTLYIDGAESRSARQMVASAVWRAVPGDEWARNDIAMAAADACV